VTLELKRAEGLMPLDDIIFDKPDNDKHWYRVRYELF